MKKIIQGYIIPILFPSSFFNKIFQKIKSAGIFTAGTSSAVLCLLLFSSSGFAQNKANERDLIWFLQKLRTVEHLPELEHSKTVLASTWDRSGKNFDGHDFKRIENGCNILLDIDGPGCIHRIFAGQISSRQESTRIQIFIDRHSEPLIDLPITEFFNDENGPIPYPLVFHKSYPGTFFPVPFERHIRVQLVNKEYGTVTWNSEKWSNYWQLTYSKYSPKTKVKSLNWPLREREKRELKVTAQKWLEAESKLPDEPSSWSIEKNWSIDSGSFAEISLKDCGIVRQMRLKVDPPTPEILRNVRMVIYWDGAENPSVDVPVGYFFGNAECGYGRQLTSTAAVLEKRASREEKTYTSNFNSLLLGLSPTESYSLFPMPFAEGAKFRFENRGAKKVDNLRLKLDSDVLDDLPENWGRFHATWSEVRAACNSVPKIGPENVPVKVVLDRRATGKYVGAMLHVQWPYIQWWGEGDWLIWSDEEGWPPGYHGTGSEEYFNSGWGQFDRKAVSGFVTVRPGFATVYSFHLNDAFQFQHTIKVYEEQMGHQLGNMIVHEKNPLWGSTAYWYALPAQSSGSQRNLLSR